MKLRPTQAKILANVMLVPGITGPKLAWMVYGYAPSSENAIAVQVHYINKAIAKYGLRVKGNKGPKGGYNLIKVEQ